MGRKERLPCKGNRFILSLPFRHSLRRAPVCAWCYAAIVMVIRQGHQFFSSLGLVSRGGALCQGAYGCGCFLSNAPVLGWQPASDKPLAAAMGYLT